MTRIISSIWSARPVRVLMISRSLSVVCTISSMPCRVCCMASAPFFALTVASSLILAVCPAFCAFCAIEAVISSTLDEISEACILCSSAPAASSSAAAVILITPWFTWSVFILTLLSISCNLSMKALTHWLSRSISSFSPLGNRLVRSPSPWAISCINTIVYSIRLITCVIMGIPKPTSNAMITKPIIM